MDTSTNLQVGFTRATAKVTWENALISERIEQLDIHIKAHVYAIQHHAQRLNEDFGYESLTTQEPHSVSFGVNDSLESLASKVQRLTVFQAQRHALILIRREIDSAC